MFARAPWARVRPEPEEVAMERSTPPAELLQASLELQQRLWANWLESMQRAGAAGAGTAGADPVAAWQASVQQALEAQAALVQGWGETLGALQRQTEDLRAWVQQGQALLQQWDALLETAQQGQELLGRWLDLQRQLWAGWSALATQGPGAAGAGAARWGQDAAQLWQETARQALEAQAAWARRWATGPAGGPAEGGERESG
jgi:hypothetical protein